MKKLLVGILALASVSSFASCKVVTSNNLMNSEILERKSMKKGYEVELLRHSFSDREYYDANIEQIRMGDVYVVSDAGISSSIIDFPKMDVHVEYTDASGTKIKKSKQVRCVTTSSSNRVNISNCSNKAARVAARLLPDANEVCF